MKKHVFLSILVPVYNVEPYLPRCLDSLLCQNLPDDVEIICVDDGSTDRSGAICDEYAEKDAHVKVIHQKNKGVAGARNTLLKSAQGKYLAFVDSDDYVSEDWYGKIRSTLERENCEVLLFDYCITEPKGSKNHLYEKQSGYLDRDKFLLDFLADLVIQGSLWQMIYKRSLFSDITFPEELVVFEDYMTIPKILLKSKTVFYLHEVLYCYCLRNSSLTLARKDDYDRRIMCFRLAVERYDYFRSLGYDVSQMGCCLMALRLCLKNNIPEISKNEQIYATLARKMIRQNLVTILKEPKCPNNLKLAFSLASIGLYDLAIKIRTKMKGTKAEPDLEGTA